MQKFAISRFLLVLAALSLAQSLNFSHPAMAQEGAAGNFKALDGFKVDLVHDISGAGHGSWVSMCVDDKARILASDQYGKLYRVTLTDGKPSVDQLDVNIGMAQGMLYAFDSLYININARPNQLGEYDAEGPGVYRLTDTDADDQFDKIEQLVKTAGEQVGEHGPHALILSPDGSQIYFCCGNQVPIPDSVQLSRVPRHWDEDHLLGRMSDAGGHMAGKPAPGGWICKMDPNGENQELIVTGFRNEYDIAFNQVGELFTYDADMEWDIGSPWYRPTRVNHVISGAEFGWRNGTGKWPDYYGDSFGAVVNIGPGSPTGITFGTGTKFPAKYQQALFINDWSYGIIYAVHLQPKGASYVGEAETFLTASPMAVTDIVVHPDGNLYFAVGGRKTQSTLYRVRYTGDAVTEPTRQMADTSAAKARSQRHALEAFHGKQDPASVALAMKFLGSSDRALRTAARIALEHQPVATWREQALQLDSPQAIISAAYALARVGSKSDRAALNEKLSAIDFNALPLATKLELLRAHNLCWIRLGAPTEAEKANVLAQIDNKFPARSSLLNRELALTLVYLNAPAIVDRVVAQMHAGGSQEDQIHYAFCLREMKNGWTSDTRHNYFKWFYDIASARGGRSFMGFIKNFRAVALEELTDEQKSQLGDLAGEMPAPRDPYAQLEPRDVVANWTVKDVQSKLAALNVKPDFEKGRILTSTAQCFKCHRFAGEGGIQGPDLTALSGRFNETDMLTHIIEPDKEISDQYQATQFLTDDGKLVTGRVANLNGNNWQVMTNMMDPGNFTSVPADAVIERRASTVSMMPAGLLNTFSAEEISQMLAYLKSGGRDDHAVYQQ